MRCWLKMAKWQGQGHTVHLIHPYYQCICYSCHRSLSDLCAQTWTSFNQRRRTKKIICLISWKLFRCKKGIIACILRQFLTCYFLLFEYSKFFTIMIEENVVLLFVKFLKLMIKITINEILETNHFSGSSSCKSSLTLQFVDCCMTRSIGVLFQLTKNYITNL